MVKYFDLSSIYSNPFFRCLEFVIGVQIASIIKDDKFKNSKINKALSNWIAFIFEIAILIGGVTLASTLGIAVGNYMLYSWVGLPIFILMMITLSQVDSNFLAKSKFFSYLSRISFCFYLAQFFNFKAASFILNQFGLDNNLIKILLSFSLCVIITVILHEIFEKPVCKFLRSKMIKI